MKKREILTPDLTPLIDVVFILLIFFIVSSVFKKDELALVLNLPSAAAQEIELNTKELIIELSPKSLALNNKKLELAEFEKKVKDIKNKKVDVLFRIDKEVKYEKIVKVLDILQKYELYNLSLITEKK
ncbi:MAG: biopolymer transporter ExbD [Campylobacteraceae bacterium]|nr:biopolymer transporter ExbD [Campylobacteraceae bacterium]